METQHAEQYHDPRSMPTVAEHDTSAGAALPNSSKCKKEHASLMFACLSETISGLSETLAVVSQVLQEEDIILEEENRQLRQMLADLKIMKDAAEKALSKTKRELSGTQSSLIGTERKMLSLQDLRGQLTTDDAARVSLDSYSAFCHTNHTREGIPSADWVSQSLDW